MLKFGLVGCGRIAIRHAEQISRIGRLSAVADIVVEKAYSIGRSYNANVYKSLDELLENESGLDVISVCTPNGLHSEHTIKSLSRGFHVLCEKPMALNTRDCGDMIKEAERANRRLFIVKQNRYNPPVAVTRKLIDEGRLGKLLSFQLNCFWNRNSNYYNDSDWKGTIQFDGGTLFTQFSHFIDLLYWMLGDVKNINAITRNQFHEGIIEFEDTGAVLLEFYNGVIGTLNYTVNSFGKNMEGSLTLFGEKGTIKIGGQYLNELEYQNIKDYKITHLPTGNPANSYGEYSGSMSNHNLVYDNLVDVLLNNGQIGTNGFEGLKTVEIIEKIYNAASTR
jgi:predicted dehydrogenase